MARDTIRGDARQRLHRRFAVVRLCCDCESTGGGVHGQPDATHRLGHVERHQSFSPGVMKRYFAPSSTLAKPAPLGPPVIDWKPSATMACNCRLGIAP